MMCGGIATSRMPASDLGVVIVYGALRSDRSAANPDHFVAEVDVTPAQFDGLAEPQRAPGRQGHH